MEDHDAASPFSRAVLIELSWYWDLFSTRLRSEYESQAATTAGPKPPPVPNGTSRPGDASLSGLSLDLEVGAESDAVAGSLSSESEPVLIAGTQGHAMKRTQLNHIETQ